MNRHSVLIGLGALLTVSVGVLVPSAKTSIVSSRVILKFKPLETCPPKNTGPSKTLPGTLSFRNTVLRDSNPLDGIFISRKKEQENPLLFPEYPDKSLCPVIRTRRFEYDPVHKPPEGFTLWNFSG